MKHGPVRSRKWLEAVRSVGYFVLCGSTDGIQAAHRNEGKGMGVKAHDHMAACLCHRCHHEIDNGKNLVREERRARMDRAIVLTLDALVRAGKVVTA